MTARGCVAYPLFERELVDVASTANGSARLPTHLSDDAGIKQFPLDNKAGHVDLGRNLVTTLSECSNLVQPRVLLFLGGIRVFAEVFECVPCTMVDTITMLLTKA